MIFKKNGVCIGRRVNDENGEKMTASTKTTKQAILDESKKELIRQNIHLVKMIASKMAIFLPRHIDCEDLVHEGIVGLMDAAVKFDTRYGMKFSTYASIRIKGSILDSLRAMDWVPRRIRKLSKKIESARDELQQSLKREPSPEEISLRLEMSSDKLSKVMNAVEQSHMLSFEDLQTFSNRYFHPEDKMNPIHDGRQHTDFERVEIKEQLKNALSHLSEKEKLVLALYYLEDLTLKEIKHIMHISEARISQIHTASLRKLRAYLNGNGNIRNKPEKSVGRPKSKKTRKRCRSGI